MISVQDLEYTYPKSMVKTINDINFDIKKGEILGFLGSSGAGKTTTQRIIIGLLKNYDGSVQVMGKERNQWNREFFEKTGIAFDFPNLYLKLTAEENLKLISSYYKNKNTQIDHLLEQVGLLKDKNKKVENFSKGMKMRLNFIRSIIHDPDLLFFDEPTSGLDPVNAKVIKDMILDLKNKGETIFLTTHNMTVAEQLCDRVAFIVYGYIPIIDKPNNLKLEHGSHKVHVEYFENDLPKLFTCSLDTIGNNKEF